MLADCDSDLESESVVVGDVLVVIDCV
jgi:hypothetical protein